MRLERVLKQEKSELSVKKAAELTQFMYQVTFTLPESKHTKSKLLKMDELQTENRSFLSLPQLPQPL